MADDMATHGRASARIPKQQRSRETQHAILEAALAVFAERGYEGASMRRIGQRAGVGQPLVVYHFPTKEALWIATVKAALGKFLERIAPLLDALDGLDPTTTVRFIFKQFVHFCAATPELLPLMIEANRRGGPVLTQVIDDQLRITFESLRRLIEAGQTAGNIPSGDPALIYYSMVAVASMVFALPREFEVLTGRDPRDPDIVEAQADLLGRLFFTSVNARGRAHFPAHARVLTRTSDEG